jgi:hypothetical protein
MWSFLKFWASCFAEAWSHAWTSSGIVAAAVALFIPFLLWLKPKWITPTREVAVNDLTWQVPLTALVAVFAVCFILSPYWIYQRKNEEISALKKQIVSGLKLSPEFRQRQDRFAQTISELNDINTEFHLISARYALVAVRNAGLPLAGEQAERNTALIASINEQREGVEKNIKLWDKNIENLHLIYRNLTLETDAPEIERTIAIVKVASDELKKALGGYSSVLHILETTNEFMKTTLAESAEKMRQINQEFDRKIENLNLDYERKVDKINLDYERQKEKLEKK